MFYAMGAAALLRLRRSRPDLPRPYRVWAYPVAPLVFIAFSAWLVGSAIVDTPRESLIGVAIVALGLPGYWYWGRNLRPSVAV
jgi:APA family basic amino acid/polyamine antiporter